VRAADGHPISPAVPGVTVHDGDHHVLVTVDETLLRQPGKLGRDPWTLEVGTRGLKPGQSVKYQYSVFASSSLKLVPDVRAPSFVPGARLTLRAAVIDGARPVLGLDDVAVDVTRPNEGIGNWFALHKVTAAELATVPEHVGQEQLDPRQRKARYLERAQVSWPARKNLGTIPLFDDGTHGDEHAQDGVYSNVLSDTPKEGSYTFRFHATGKSEAGGKYRREGDVRRYLKPRFLPEKSAVTALVLDDVAGAKRASVTVTPRDALGNYLGPGLGSGLAISVRGGRTVGAPVDLLDGSYTQLVEAPAGVAVGARIDVTLGGAKKTVIWPAPASKGVKFNWLVWSVCVLGALVVLVVLYLRSNRAPSSD
jgi:hypothetical protein